MGYAAHNGSYNSLRQNTELLTFLLAFILPGKLSEYILFYIMTCYEWNTMMPLGMHSVLVSLKSTVQWIIFFILEVTNFQRQISNLRSISALTLQCKAEQLWFPVPNGLVCCEWQPNQYVHVNTTPTPPRPSTNHYCYESSIYCIIIYFLTK